MSKLPSNTQQEDKLCPIHGSKLESMNIPPLESWYCKDCDCYYIESSEELARRMTILGKKVMSLPGILPSEEHSISHVSTFKTDSQIIRSEKNETELFPSVESQFNNMPSSSTIQYCPIHKKQIDNRKVLVSDGNGWSALLDIGYCKKCNCFYTNDQNVIWHDSITAFELPVAWNPNLFVKYCGKKKLTPYFETEVLNLQNLPVHIENTLSSLEKNTTADAWNVITMPDGFITRIHGVYSIRHQEFICSVINYLSAITPDDDKYVVRIDPNQLVINARNNLPNKSIKAANKAARKLRKKYYEKQEAIRKKYCEEQEAIRKKEDRRKWMERTALPYSCYTLPLLKGYLQCPFCGSALTKHCLLRVVVYKDRQANKTIFEKGWYCLTCKIPFIDSKTEMQLLKTLSPNMIYVFDAKACSTPQELLERAKKRILVHDERVQTTPQSKEKNSGVFLEESDTVPNLSYLPNTKVFVYSEKCHCTKCEKKYKTNTIQNRTALVETITHQTVQVTVQFCRCCGKYYMNLQTFRQYCKKYGGILLECTMEPELYQTNSSWLNFHPDSILSRCGYSVKEGISQNYRQTVLAYILDSKKATKHEILEMISGFIRIRHNRMPGACRRWEEDLLFVSLYKIQNQQQVTGLSFKQISGH